MTGEQIAVAIVGAAACIGLVLFLALTFRKTPIEIKLDAIQDSISSMASEVDRANSIANATQLKLCELVQELEDKSRPEDGQLVAYDYLGEIYFGKYHAANDTVDHEMSGEIYPLTFRDVGRWKVVEP